ncbi:MAG: hypothetical protein R3F34_08375 [Planctomycetota bacterium]
MANERPALRAPRTLVALALLAASFATASCRETGTEPPEVVTFETPLVVGADAELLASVQPADVFVVPVLDETETFGTPTEGLRRAIYAGLVQRLYSPIRMEWADAVVADLAKSGAPPSAQEANAALGADAFLEVRVLAWDETELESDGTVRVRLEAVLRDPADPEHPLWGYRMGRLVDVGGVSARRATHDVLVGRAVEKAAADLLALLPQRDARSAPR